MSSETMNHNLLIATAKTPHKVLSNGPSDIIIDPTGKPLPGTNWDDLKKLRKAGPLANTQNTFIDGAVIYIRTGRIDAASQSSHPVPGPGKSSGMFRGDTSAMLGSPDLYKERRAVMRTSDVTLHNCMPPTGPSNTSGKILINLAATDLSAQLRDQIKKLCQIVDKDKTGAYLHFGECKHGRKCPSGGQLEVVKSGNGEEVLKFSVTRMDTTIAPPGDSKCQEPGLHASWTAQWGATGRGGVRDILKEEKGVDKFEVSVPGFTSPALTGVLPAVKWMLDTISGPQIMTVTALACANSRSTVVRCYPNGKLAVNFTQEIVTFRKRLENINRILNFVVQFSRVLNGGKVSTMVFEFLPGSCELAFECEFKERDNHLVGAEWKATFGFNPLALLKFSWPIPLEIFLGPFGAVARTAQWLAEWAGLRGDLSIGFTFQVVVAGVIERSKDGVYSPGFDAAIEFVPNCTLTLSRGPAGAPTHKLTVTLSVTFSVKLAIRPNDKGQGAVKGVVSGEIQVGFSIEYEKKGNSPKKLVDYKPEWAKWPQSADAGKLGEFVIF